VTKNDVVLLDKLCHASLIDAAKLSGARLRVFPHNNLHKLESHLEWARREYAGKRVLIVTESVFSMDGDRAPLRELIELKKRFDALLMLDEAHAVGVIGLHGRGLAAAENLSERCRCPDGHDEQGARDEWRLRLRLSRPDRMAD
jgi:7-keto-8-aminopelargonate synthetase and related enzymes